MLLLSLTIQVKEARHQPARAEERYFLELPERNWPFVREVLMQVDGRPWLFGRTIVPGETLQHQGRRLKMLKNRPLGEVLFDCEQPSRAFIEVAAINSEHWLYPDDPALLSSTDDESRLLWARRSLFYFNGKPLLVQEVFLPSCPFKRPDAD